MENSSHIDNSFVGDHSGMNQSRLDKSYFKVAVIGAHNVGKTSFLIRLIESRFLESYYPTNKENHFTKSISIKDENVPNYYNVAVPDPMRNSKDLDGVTKSDSIRRNDNNGGGGATATPQIISNTIINRENINLELIDTMGQDCKNESNLNISYWKSFMNLDGCILCYNVNNVESFNILGNLWSKIVTQFELPTGDFPLLLLGTKCDAVNNDGTVRQVTWTQGSGLARELNALFFECSAKDDYNIDLSMSQLTLRMEILRNKKLGINTSGNGDKCIVM